MWRQSKIRRTIALACGVNAARDAHQHVLRALDNAALALEQVRALERLEAKVVVAKVALVHNRRFQSIGVALNESEHIICGAVVVGVAVSDFSALLWRKNNLAQKQTHQRAAALVRWSLD